MRKSACTRGSAEDESETGAGPNASRGIAIRSFSLYCFIVNKAREGTFIVNTSLIIAVLTFHYFRSRIESLKSKVNKYNSGNLNAFSFCCSFAF